MDDTGIAVADAPEIAESTAPETTTVETDSTEVDTDGEVDGTEAPEGETQPETGERSDALMLDGNRPSPKVTKLLQDIKSKDPRFATQLRRALIDNAQLGKSFPGGLKDAVALHQKFESLGGEHGLATMQNDLAVFGEAYGQFADGSPSFAETLAEDNPEAFAKIAPAVISKYESANPEAFGAFLAGRLFSEMRESGLYLAIDRLQDFIDPSNEKAVNTYNAITGFINQLSQQAAKKQATAPNAAAKTGDTRDAEFKTREDNLRRNEWTLDTNSARKAAFESEFTRLSQGRKVSSDQAATIKELTVGRIQKALTGNKDFNSKLDRYFQANDRDGFVKMFKNEYATILKAAMRDSFDKILGVKRGPETGTPRAQAQNGTPAQPGTPSKGFTWVSSKPALAEVDMGRTERDDWLAGKAILKDGSRVQWRVK